MSKTVKCKADVHEDAGDAIAHYLGLKEDNGRYVLEDGTKVSGHSLYYKLRDMIQQAEDKATNFPV